MIEIVVSTTLAGVFGLLLGYVMREARHDAKRCANDEYHRLLRYMHEDERDAADRS